MTYRENARDMVVEHEALVDRVANLESRPAKEPTKPLTNRQWSRVHLFLAMAGAVAGGIVAAGHGDWWPASVGIGAASLMSAFAAAMYADAGDK